MSWYAAGITKCSPQKNKSLLSLSNNLLNNIGIKNDLHTNRISEILCGQSFIIDTILNSIQATLLSVLLSRVLQWDCGWQVLCAVWFSFTDVQFSLSRSSLCTSNSHVSPLPPLSLSPCWYGENQWLLYSVEGLMSANEILSAMSHPSDSCWDSDRQKDRLPSIIYDHHTNTQAHLYKYTLLCWVQE